MSDKDPSEPPDGDDGSAGGRDGDGSSAAPDDVDDSPDAFQDGEPSGSNGGRSRTVGSENDRGPDTGGRSSDGDTNSIRDRSPDTAGQSLDSVVSDPDEIDPEELTVPVRSLHPRVRILWILRAAITATVVGSIVAVVDRFLVNVGPELPIGVGGVLLILGIAHALLHYRIWRYEVRADALYLERGVLTRVRTVVPFVRIQHVDTSRSPVERLVGLSTSVVYTAGSRGADVSIPGLEEDRAEDLQARLKQLAIAAEGDDAV